MTKYLLADNEGNMPQSAIICCYPIIQSYNCPFHKISLLLLTCKDPVSPALHEVWVTLINIDQWQFNPINMTCVVVFDVMHSWRIYGSSLNSPYSLWMFNLSGHLQLELTQKKDGSLGFKTSWLKEVKGNLEDAISGVAHLSIQPTFVPCCPFPHLFDFDLLSTSFQSHEQAYKSPPYTLLPFRCSSQPALWFTSIWKDGKSFLTKIGDSLAAQEAQAKQEMAKQNGIWDELQSLAEQYMATHSSSHHGVEMNTDLKFPYVQPNPSTIDLAGEEEPTGREVYIPSSPSSTLLEVEMQQGPVVKEDLVYPFGKAMLDSCLSTPGPIMTSSLLPTDDPLPQIPSLEPESLTTSALAREVFSVESSKSSLEPANWRDSHVAVPHYGRPGAHEEEEESLRPPMPTPSLWAVEDTYCPHT
ncbi:hypothetical protein EDD18DRAFT_1360458 [Armillaria luteobubalina]|uniref:Uncharacterized protein n=1 Tax=Armillaria luteobubalina TaxID=153913 RepID=A0AA39PMF0_9AGAR|nr:hypothetical protein EDD18DRAFT_1360458 [Armillaria luteobubalina]